ncbi:MAG: glycosyltransferase family 2 protein [Bacteroidetes bacterium]|nr:glycosyltransferase family 2 protein [Bacteroidota bacterium]
MPDISVIIPIFNEEESLPELCTWIDRVMAQNNFSYETILVDDGSTDKTWKVIEQLSAKNNNIRGFRLKKNYGKSAALNTGFDYSKGNVVITMDGDLQDSPDEIPGLVKMIRDDGYDLISGWKKTRHDPLSKTIPSKLFNLTTGIMSGVKLHDFNCGLKAYRSDVIKNIEVSGEMHRYIPVLAKWAGFTRIGEKVVQHSRRKYGVTKFGIERFVNGFLDFLSVAFITRYMKKPMHFFGTLGIVSFGTGSVIGLYLTIMKFFYNTPLTNRPMLFLVVLLILLGIQLLFIGLLAELISRASPERNKYLVEKITGNDGQN